VGEINVYVKITIETRKKENIELKAFFYINRHLKDV